MEEQRPLLAPVYRKEPEVMHWGLPLPLDGRGCTGAVSQSLKPRVPGASGTVWGNVWGWELKRSGLREALRRG